LISFDDNEPQPSPADSFYTDESFLFSNADITSDTDTTTTSGTSTDRSSKPAPRKSDFVMREIVHTEESFLGSLELLMKDFLLPLASCIVSDSDRKVLFMNIEQLIGLHRRLFDELCNACKGAHGRTMRVCAVFVDYKLELMREYAEYFSCIDAALAKCDTLQNTNAEFKAKLDECRRASRRGTFKLTDSLRLPYQRVLKYHLLFNELLKQTDREHRAREQIKQTKDAMCEVGNYLNECQRDKENLVHIERLMSHLLMPPTATNIYSAAAATLKDYGHFIRDDNIRVKSLDLNERLARTRQLFLFDKALLICKSKSNNIYNCKERLMVSDYQLSDPQQPAVAGGADASKSLSGHQHHQQQHQQTLELIGSLSQSNTPLFLLISADNTKIYSFAFKNKEQKRLWKESFAAAKDKVQPSGYKSNEHSFALHNFERNMAACVVCKQHLLGLFFQGYKCEQCGCVAHKNCLTKTTSPCAPAAKSSPRQPQQQQPSTPLAVSSSAVALERSLSTSSLGRNRQLGRQLQQYCVRAIYNYDGRPKPPEQLVPFLRIKEGDIIQVTDDDDDEWWKGFILENSLSLRSSTNSSAVGGINGTDSEGYFPRRFVKSVNNMSSRNASSSNTIAALMGALSISGSATIRQSQSPSLSQQQQQLQPQASLDLYSTNLEDYAW
jgi:hypothetical protein